MDLLLRPFVAIDLADKFFDSLMEAYPEFSDWYNRKTRERAVTDVEPVLPAKRRLKVGTFKTTSIGTEGSSETRSLFLQVILRFFPHHFFTV